MRLVGITARAALVLLAATLLLVGPSRAVAAQEPAPEVPDTASVDTDTTTTLADLDTPTGPVREAPLTDSEKASRTIQWVVIGLVVLAFVVLVATAFFWRRTRPSRLIAQDVAANAAAQTPVPIPPVPEPAVSAHPLSGPPAPMPTSPGSWTAFASAAGVGNEVIPTATASSSSNLDEPTAAHPVVVGPSAADPEPQPQPEAPGVMQPPKPPRPAFETTSAGSWASQGWGDGSNPPPEAPVLPEGFAGTPPIAPSWKWDQRADATGGTDGVDETDSSDPGSGSS